MKTGRAYGPIGQLATYANLSANTIYYYPVVIDQQAAVTALVWGKITNIAGNGIMGVYADNNGQPGSMIFQTGGLSLLSAGALQFAVSQNLAPGLYWLACLADVSFATFTWGAWYEDIGFDPATAGYMCTGYSQAYGYGGLPANATPVVINNAIPAMTLGIKL